MKTKSQSEYIMDFIYMLQLHTCYADVCPSTPSSGPQSKELCGLKTGERKGKERKCEIRWEGTKGRMVIEKSKELFATCSLSVFAQWRRVLTLLEMRDWCDSVTPPPHITMTMCEAQWDLSAIITMKATPLKIAARCEDEEKQTRFRPWVITADYCHYGPIKYREL